MSSNLKGKNAGKESPTEPFKRAVAGCLRAIAKKPDLEVSFAAERPGLAGGKVRLPEPPRKLGKQDDAIEQARVEAIGARRMDGVARNLAAMLDDRFHRGKYDEITDRADAPIEDALAMMVRERLTGETPPPTARKLVD